MSCASGLLTTTCGSTAGGAPAELPLALGEYLSHAPTNTTPASTAAIHILADARPLFRGRLFSTRSSDVSCVSVTIPLPPPELLFLLSPQLKLKRVNASFAGPAQSDWPGLFSRAISRSYTG